MTNYHHLCYIHFAKRPFLHLPRAYTRAFINLYARYEQSGTQKKDMPFWHILHSQADLFSGHPVLIYSDAS